MLTNPPELLHLEPPAGICYGVSGEQITLPWLQWAARGLEEDPIVRCSMCGRIAVWLSEAHRAWGRAHLANVTGTGLIGTTDDGSRILIRLQHVSESS